MAPPHMVTRLIRIVPVTLRVQIDESQAVMVREILTFTCKRLQPLSSGQHLHAMGVLAPQGMNIGALALYAVF